MRARLTSLLRLASGRLSRRLTGAFIVIIAVLAVVVMVVGSRITTESIEARAENELENDEAIVRLYLRQLEDDIIFLNEIFASSQILTEELTVPSASRSLMISLITDLRHRGMTVRMYEREPPADHSSFSIVQKGFLGIRMLGLAVDSAAQGSEAWLVSVAPIETESRVERVASVSFPLSAEYLKGISARIGADITLLLPRGQAISTLPPATLASLIQQLKERGRLAEKAEESLIYSVVSAGNPAKALVSPLTINLKWEGHLILSIPMADLLAAKRSIVSKVLLSTIALLSAASFLYLSSIRRITKPLAQLSAATRDVAAGNLDLQVRVVSNDEVGELAASFNTMIRRLRESREEIECWNRTLEERVEERTHSLEAARSELKAMNSQLIRALDEVRRTQDKMIRAEKLAALGQMASAIAHEVRNPLAGMKGALQVLRREEAGGDRAPIIQLVIDQIDRLAETTNRLLSFARPATPRQTPSDLTDLIRQARLLVEEQAKERGVSIVMSVEPLDHRFSVDPQLTLQAFLNIALNAVQAMSRGGTLTIASTYHREAQEAVVTFADTGAGMSPEVLEKIFTPFFTTKHQGTGLGLYVAKDIIEQQGGRIEASSAPGAGTVFTVRFPTQESPGLQSLV